MTTPSKILSFKFGTTPGITCITRIWGTVLSACRTRMEHGGSPPGCLARVHLSRRGPGDSTNTRWCVRPWRYGWRRTLLPWLVAMPVLGGLLWWRIGHSLQPLTAVAQALSTRTLTHWICSGHRAAAPGARLVTVLNDLLQRQPRRSPSGSLLPMPLMPCAPRWRPHLQAHLVTQASEEAERGEAIARYNAVSNAPRTSCRSCSRSPTWSPWPPTSPCTLWPSIQSSMQSRRPCCPGRRKRD